MIKLLRMVIAALIFSCPVSLQGQVPYTQQLIDREIARLGGETEAPSGLVFVAFRGSKFTPQEFEMISHLSQLRWFSASETKGDDSSLRYLKELRSLKRVDVHSSGGVVDGLVHLSGHPTVEEIQLTEVKLSEKSLNALCNMPALKKVELDFVEVPSGSLEFLVRICKKSDLTFGALTGISDDDLQSLLRENEDARTARKKSSN